MEVDFEISRPGTETCDIKSAIEKEKAKECGGDISVCVCGALLPLVFKEEIVRGL